MILSNKIQNTSIRIKMLVISIWVGIITLLISFAIFLTYDFVTVRSERIQEHLQMAKMIGKNNRVTVDFKVWNSAKADLYKLLSSDKTVQYGCIFGQEDSVFVDYDRDIFLNVLDGNLERLSNALLSSTPEMLDSPINPQYKPGGVNFDWWGNKLEVYRVTKDEADDNKNNTVYIRSSLNDLYSRYTRYLIAIFAIFVVTVIMATLLSFKLLRMVSDPILALSEKALEVSKSKDYSIRVDIGDRKDEIGTLSSSFNEMLERIQQQSDELISAKEQAEKAREQAERSKEQAERSKEQAEKARERAEFLAEAKQQFLAAMSHEIRTPMNGIIGTTALLEEEELGEKERKYLGIIKASADHLLVIVNDILDYTKIESGKLQFEQAIVDLPQTIDTIVAGHQKKVNEKGLSIQVNIDEAVPKTFVGDPVRLSQILTNLFSNAVKFTIEGEVRISCRLVSREASQVCLRFSVKDTGIGIPRNKFNDIFEVFTQASESTTRKFGGTGLGLSISKRLVEMQGGEMFLESELGKGSTFSFEIWFKTNTEEIIGKQKPLNRVKISRDIGRGKRILLAEDNEVNQQLVETLLERWGYEVEAVENGLEALEKVRKNSYALVLMDMHMPELDGYEATMAIRKQLPVPKCNIPIIAMTASALKGEAERCLEAGMDDYISKPFDKNILYQKMVNLIS